ncbi:MAG: hypothetical protein JJT94_14610 [Bernardetiaceae bacterium]|nr:hypothetical protein [Bernardetiaceae bacterium]
MELEVSKHLKNVEAHGEEANTKLLANSCRKCAEAVAHVVALHSKDPRNSKKLSLAVSNNKFEDFIQIIESEKLANSEDENKQKKVVMYLRFLQRIGNVGSHDNIMEKSEHIACVQVLTCLLTWFYDDFLNRAKPQFLIQKIANTVEEPIKQAIQQQGDTNVVIGQTSDNSVINIGKRD